MPTSRRYLLIAPLPFTVAFPKSKHELAARELGGGGTTGHAAEHPWVLWIHDFDKAGNSAGSWRVADAYGQPALNDLIYRGGFDVPWPSAPATILERAVRDGLAKRLDRINF